MLAPPSELLRFTSEYMFKQKGLGDTRLMLEGALNYKKPFFLVTDTLTSANVLKSKFNLKMAHPVTPELIHMGNLPIAFDNSAISYIFRSFELAMSSIRMYDNDRKFYTEYHIDPTLDPYKPPRQVDFDRYRRDMDKDMKILELENKITKLQSEIDELNDILTNRVGDFFDAR